MKYFIQTFGCAQNEADSERMAAVLNNRSLKPAEELSQADYVVINTCMVRKSAENRVYGLVNNLSKIKIKKPGTKIILTGCMVGIAVRDKTGKYLKHLREILPAVDEFLPIDEVGFENTPLRVDKTHALIPIASGCNNFCSYCVVPYSRGAEVSRPFGEIIEECKKLAEVGYKSLTLLGMNVNSYGADLVNEARKSERESSSGYKMPDGKMIKPVLVKHLGKTRIPTLFPSLLNEIAHIKGLEKIYFLSANPWDFSDELIKVIAANPKISRDIHLAVQSGSDAVLKRMNRWYTQKEYLDLLVKMRQKIPGLRISTDIIVGFCGETDGDFAETVKLVKEAGFYKAYIAVYSDRPMTVAHKLMKDDIPFKIKKQRWKILEDLINKPNTRNSKHKVQNLKSS